MAIFTLWGYYYELLVGEYPAVLAYAPLTVSMNEAHPLLIKSRVGSYVN